MIRLADAGDAAQLLALNDEFNGAGNATLEDVSRSLRENRQEIVVVAEEAGELVGFVCAQRKRSFCYAEETAEITEVFVKPAFRRRGFARDMIAFAERHCAANFPVRTFELLTGAQNRDAQSLYRGLGYVGDREKHFRKRLPADHSTD